MAAQPWTGETACALQKALRLSNERFAEHLGIGVRTVASWHQKSTVTPQSEVQQLLDTAYERASAAVQQRFAERVGAASTAPQSEPEAGDGTVADAELRLSADENINAALEWLDTGVGWEPGTSRRKVADRLTQIDARRLRDRGVRRGQVTRAQVTQALLGYYGSGSADEYGLYAPAHGVEPAASTTILTRSDWLDLASPLLTAPDGLTLGDTSTPDPAFDDHTIDAAVQRIAETLELGTRLVNMPLYGLRGVDINAPMVSGSLGITPFVQYALTMDMLEGELLDAISADDAIGPGRLPLRDRYLPDLPSVTAISDRLCAGGALALCAIARPAGVHGDADYLLLIQQRSGNVVNANRQLAVIPKGFHQPVADPREDTRLGSTLLREMEEELFGRADLDNTVGDQRNADPMHPSRLSEPMRWLLERPLDERFNMECTGFGFNLVSGNFEFPSLIVISDDEFWVQYGGVIEANWESASLRRYSTLDTERLTELIDDVAWSNEGLFAMMQGLRRLAELGGQRVRLPSVDWEIQ